MNLLLLGYDPKYFWKGSATLYYQNALAEHLSDNSVFNVMLYYPPPRCNVLNYMFLPLQIHHKDSLNILNGGVIQLLWYLVREKNVLLHFVVIRNYMVWIAMCARLVRRKMVVTLHDTFFLYRKKKNDSIISKKMILRLVQNCFLQSHFDKALVTKYSANIRSYMMKIGVSEIASHHNGINENKKILFAGGLDLSYKGLKYLEDSLRTVKNSYELIVCGENSNNSLHSNYIGELDRNGFQKLLTSVRMVIVPSEYESYSMTALESLAAGVPVILTEECGIVQYLTDGSDCFKVKFGDVNSLTKKINALLSDNLMWGQLSKNGLNTAEKFSWENIAADYIKIYQKILVQG